MFSEKELHVLKEQAFVFLIVVRYLGVAILAKRASVERRRTLAPEYVVEFKPSVAPSTVKAPENIQVEKSNSLWKWVR